MTDTVILEQKPLTRDGGEKASVIRQRLYIFPSQHGLVFCTMLAVMLMGAINYTNSMAYMLTFMLASLLLVCMLHTYRNLRGLILSCTDAKPVFAGETAEFPMVLDNRSGPDRINLNIRCWPARRRLRMKSVSGIEHCRVSGGQLYRGMLPVAATQRGLLKPGRLRIDSCYPLGLLRAWSYMNCNSVCTVYPRPEGDPRLPAHSPADSQETSGDLIGTDDFTGFRHYRPGDSIRNIDWKILAREQGVMVKKFSGSGARQLCLHWGQTATLSDTETRLSQLALWLINAEQEGLRYSLEIPGFKSAPGNGEAHQQHCLTALARYDN